MSCGAQAVPGRAFYRILPIRPSANHQESGFRCATRHRSPGPAFRHNTRGQIEFLLRTIPGHTQALSAACARVADWHSLFAYAGRHGVEPVLYHAVRGAGWTLEPSVVTSVERQLALERLAHSTARAVLDEVLDVCECAGIRAAPLKGPLLGERIYPRGVLRPCTDLDLLVAPADLPRAAATLARLGYTAASGPSALYHRRHHHHLSLHRRGAPPLELHFRAYSGFGIELPAEDFLERASLDAHRLPRTWLLEPEDELLFLAVHAAGHLFLRLGWLLDLKLFLGCHSGLSWDRIRSRIERAGIAGPVSMTLETLRGRWGTDLGAGCELAEWCPLRSGLARCLLPRGDRTSGARPSAFRSLLFNAALSARPRSAAWLLQHHLLRAARRRVRRGLPSLAPESWAA